MKMSTTSIRFYWNGIKVNGEKLTNCMYSKDGNKITVSVNHYGCGNLPHDVFAVRNESNYYTDDFEDDYTVLTPDHPLYRFAEYAWYKAQVHDIELAIKHAVKAKKTAEIERLEIQLQNLPTVKNPGHPTASDLAKVEAMRNVEESARIKDEKGEEQQENVILSGAASEAPTVYYPISEELARAAHAMNSMRDYPENHDTDEYRRSVDQVAEIAAAQKKRVSEFYHPKIDSLLDSYSRRLAKWVDDHNRNRASCPSIMVCGGGNFPVRKKAKQNEREGVLWEEYKKIEKIPGAIKAVGTGPIDFADPHAEEMLVERIESIKREHNRHLMANRYFKRYGTMRGCPSLTAGEAAAFSSLSPHSVPFPTFVLTGEMQRLHAAEDRLEQYQKLQAVPKENREEQHDGFRLVRNLEADRLQIFFDCKPDDETRQRLKNFSFRWSPRHGAWQRKLTANAERAAKEVLGI